MSVTSTPSVERLPAKLHRFRVTRPEASQLAAGPAPGNAARRPVPSLDHSTQARVRQPGQDAIGEAGVDVADGAELLEDL